MQESLLKAKNRKNNMKNDLLKLQNNYFTASVENSKEANMSISRAQGWLLTLGLAELAFLGSQGNFSSCIVKTEITLLLLAFILFIIGSITQYKFLLKTSRYYFSLSSRILKLVEEKNTAEVEKIPDKFLNTQNLRTSNITNYLFFSSFILIVVSTILIWFNLILI